MVASRNLYPGAVLSLLVVASILAIVFRAWNQDFTIDEANTYHFYISKMAPDYWGAGSNNHLLSSLFIRISTSLFGFSPFAMRVPAIVGGSIYCISAAFLVTLLVEKDRKWLGFFLYTAFAFNPFIMDYLVAARGYAPALACEMTMLALLCREITQPIFEKEQKYRWGTLSVLAGLGVAFNYSFLFTLSSLLFCTFIFVAGRDYMEKKFVWAQTLITGLYLSVPFGLVIFLVCSNNIMTMPQSEIDIGWGTNSFLEMFQGFSRLSFNGPNPFLTPPGLRHDINLISIAAPWIVLVMLAFSSILLWVRLWKLFSKGMTGRGKELTHDKFIWIAIATLLVSLALHTLVFYVFNVKLPRTRTGIHFIPLLTILVFVPLYFQPHENNKIDKIFSMIFLAFSGLLAISFLFTLRFAYFQEWKWDADACQATETAYDYAEKIHAKNISVSWEFDATSHYYAEYLGYDPNLVIHKPNQQKPDDQIKDDKVPEVYILSARAWQDIDRAGLMPVYLSKLDGTIVAISNAGNTPVPSLLGQFKVTMSNRCPEHGWFAKMNTYPGPTIY